jgi:alpha-galactosidase
VRVRVRVRVRGRGKVRSPRRHPHRRRDRRDHRDRPDRRLEPRGVVSEHGDTYVYTYKQASACMQVLCRCVNAHRVVVAPDA